MHNKIIIPINSEKDTLSLGEKLASLCKQRVMLYLYGNCGIGKTTFSRGFLKGLGYYGYVKSPTFNIFEKYKCLKNIVYHLDFYRLNSPEELEFIGIRDFFLKKNFFLIEWPTIGEKILPSPDLSLHFKNLKSRIIHIHAISNSGIKIIQSFKNKKNEK